MLSVHIDDRIRQRAMQRHASFDQELANVLHELATQIVSLQKLDFETKSRHGTGVDGTTWAVLSPVTEEIKFRKSRAGQKQAKQTATARKRLRNAKTPEARKKALGRLQELRITPSSKSQIGVDVGLMRNAIQPGFKATSDDGLAVENVFEIRDAEVRVGYRGEYVDYFDQGTTKQPPRPLMPSDPLPVQWLDPLNLTIQTFLDEVFDGLDA